MSKREELEEVQKNEITWIGLILLCASISLIVYSIFPKEISVDQGAEIYKTELDTSIVTNAQDYGYPFVTNGQGGDQIVKDVFHSLSNVVSIAVPTNSPVILNRTIPEPFQADSKVKR